jgi:hypothetical protein
MEHNTRLKWLFDAPRLSLSHALNVRNIPFLEVSRIKGLRWLLLHRRDNLEKYTAQRLKRSLALNEPLQCAYLLKEQLGELWEQKDGRDAWGSCAIGARRQKPAAFDNSKLWRRPSFAMPRGF